MKIDSTIIAAAMTLTAIAWCSYPFPHDLCATPETPFFYFFLSFLIFQKEVSFVFFFFLVFFFSFSLLPRQKKHSPSNAAEIDPRVTLMFIQCKNVLSLAKKALASVRRSVAIRNKKKKKREAKDDEVGRRKKRENKDLESPSNVRR